MIDSKDMENLIKDKNNYIEKYPELKDDIEGLFDLTIMEIEEECSSITHEIELFHGSVKDLIEEIK